MIYKIIFGVLDRWLIQQTVDKMVQFLSIISIYIDHLEKSTEVAKLSSEIFSQRYSYLNGDFAKYGPYEDLKISPLRGGEGTQSELTESD